MCPFVKNGMHEILSRYSKCVFVLLTVSIFTFMHAASEMTLVTSFSQTNVLYMPAYANSSEYCTAPYSTACIQSDIPLLFIIGSIQLYTLGLRLLPRLLNIITMIFFFDGLMQRAHSFFFFSHMNENQRSLLSSQPLT